MFKFNSIILSSILCISISNNMQAMENFLSLFDSNKIRQQAAANIAKQEAEKKAAQITAEADRIAKERTEAIVLAAKILAKFICKTGMFSYKLATNPPRALELLKDGKSDAWIGCTGLFMSITGLVIFYKIRKRDEDAKQRFDEDTKRQEEIRKKQSEGLLQQIREAQRKEDEERRKKQNQMPRPSAPSAIYDDYETQPGLYPNIF